MDTVVGTVALLVVFAFTVVAALRHRPGVTPGPRLSPDLAEVLLLRAGFPTTPHNVLAVSEHLGTMFLDRGRGDVDAARWAEVVATCEAGRGTSPAGRSTCSTRSPGPAGSTTARPWRGSPAAARTRCSRASAPAAGSSAARCSSRCRGPCRGLTAP